MIWAIVRKTGDYVLRYDDPSQTEDKAELKGSVVWLLDREPVPSSGERVDFETGAIILDQALIDAARKIVMAAKRETAARQIAEISPTWKQQNDIRSWLEAAGISCPDPEAAARFEQIDAIRAASNNQEDVK